MTVAVVIVTHNCAQFIAETIESVKAQTQLPDRIVIIDDQSTDETMQVVRQQLITSGLSYVIHSSTTEAKDVHTRIAQNFLQGVNEAKDEGFEIVVLGDHDDIWHEERIAQHVTVFNANPGAVMVAADGVIKTDQNPAMPQTLRNSFPVPANFNDMRASQQFHYVVRHSVATGGASAIKPANFQYLNVPKGWLHDRWWSMAAAAHHALIIDTTPVIDYRISATQQVGLDTAAQLEANSRWLTQHLKKSFRSIKRLYDVVPLYITSR
jgi:glycosyltransferase involved in cell wall biosynthesis